VQLYLSDVAEGGETVFVDVPKAPYQTAAAGWTECGQEVGLQVQGLFLNSQRPWQCTRLTG
jgi:hypothetical protein